MTDLKKLRALAAKATKNVDHIAIEDTFPTMWFVDKKGENQDITNDDLIFWEKANPETVIALLDTIKKLKDERTRLRRSVRKVIRLSEEIEKYDAGKVDMAIARMARVFRGEP